MLVLFRSARSVGIVWPVGLQKVEFAVVAFRPRQIADAEDRVRFSDEWVPLCP